MKDSNEIKTEKKEIEIGVLEKYIAEWFEGYVTKYVENTGNPKFTTYTLYDFQTGTVLFETVIKTADMANAKSLSVDMNGFPDKKIQEAIEKCIEVDKLIEEIKTSRENKIAYQKGE